jgi:hypothetical protein
MDLARQALVHTALVGAFAHTERALAETYRGGCVRGVPRTFWGKLRQKEDASADCEWHPLVDHCADVAVVAEGLRSPRVWQHRLAGRERDAAAHALPGSQAEAGT